MRRWLIGLAQRVRTEPRYLFGWVIVKMVIVVLLLLVTGGPDEHDVSVVYMGF